MTLDLSEKNPDKLPIVWRHFGILPQLGFIALLLVSPVLAWGQQPNPADDSSEPPTAAEEQTSVQERNADDQFDNIPGSEGDCPPPTMNEQIMIGVGTLALLVVCYFLLVRLMEQRYILKDRSAHLGRSYGFSLTILMSSIGFLTLIYLVAGCLHPKFYLWLGFVAALWLIHLIYTVLIVRNN